MAKNAHRKARAALALAGLSQGEAAAALGVGQPTLSKILAGRQSPTVDQAVALQRLVGEHGRCVGLTVEGWSTLPDDAPTDPDHPVPGAA